MVIDLQIFTWANMMVNNKNMSDLGIFYYPIYWNTRLKLLIFAIYLNKNSLQSYSELILTHIKKAFTRSLEREVKAFVLVLLLY
ncbi:hypothetical protein A616_18810 [Brevibacillus brevis X23]|nr:hypothetical protein A616_18810 [Brevibacillus brevis X23]